MKQKMNLAQTSRTVVLAVLMSVIFVTYGLLTAQAATLTVTKTADTNDGACNADCSLREAIAAAASFDEIIFSGLFNSPRTITLDDAFGELNITTSLKIFGKGANLLTIRRSPTSAGNFRVFTMGPSFVTLRGMTITGGKSVGNVNSGGGGVRMTGSALTVQNCVITENTASNGTGGGIYNDFGSLTVTGSTISNNLADSSGFTGSAITIRDGNLTLTNSTISGNVARNGFRRSGILINNSGSQTVTISSSTITDNENGTGNTAGGVMVVFGTATICNSIIANNRDNSSVADVAVFSGTFVSNGYNLIGNRGAITAFNQTGDQTGSGAALLDPSLDSLGNYGGTMPTHRLQLISPAIDKGSSFGATTDQRGSVRPFNVVTIPNTADGADIGAFELDSFPLMVTKTADTNDGICDSDCSLREAIAAAAPGDTIQFASPLFDSPQTILLSPTFKDLAVNQNLTINGKGANLLTIQGPSSGAVKFRVFTISIGLTVTLSGMKITGGDVIGDGGGISTFGSATTVANCHLAGNVAVGFGGGIRNAGGGTLNVIGSTIETNFAQGNGANSGGGGIHNIDSTLNVTNSTVSGNAKRFGPNNAGGIWTSGGTATITNSTITDNQVVNNTSGASGLYSFNNTTVIRNTIIAANNPGLPDVDAQNGVTSDGYNLIGDVGGVTDFNQTGDQTGTAANRLNPRLVALAFNGGTTPTHRLQNNSPAADKGRNFGSNTDQRGSPRPFDLSNIAPANGGDNSDIGAFEAASLALMVTKSADSKDGVCDADCSLREAIIAAAPGDVIEFASPLFDSPQIITLQSAAGFRDLVITKNLIINGKGANLLTVRRDSAALFNEHRVFNINGTGVTVGLNNLTVADGNAVGFNGGGINANGGVSVTLTNVHVTGNQASKGAGLFITSDSSLTLINSTVSANTANSTIASGGGIHNEGVLNIINSTVSGNVKNGGNNNGGGVWNSGTATVTNSTISDNGAAGTIGAGGFHNQGAATIRSTIIAANRNNPSLPDVVGAFTSGGYNLVGYVGTATGFNQTGDQTGDEFDPLNPRLAPLGNNGGATPTHALMPQSSAIEKGRSFGLTADQRGLLRPVNKPNLPPATGGDNSDIGAFEVQAALTNTVPVSSFSPNPITVNEDTSGIIVINVEDIDADNLTLTLTDQPDHGTITSNPPACGIFENSSYCSTQVRYTPNPNFNGTDSFSFKGNDGQVDSAISVVNITVTPVADVWMVTKTADTNDGVCGASDCSLREAIEAASAGDTIEFAAVHFGTARVITLSGLFGELIVNKNLTINGKGANLLTVRRDSSPGSIKHRIFKVRGAGVTVDLNNLTVADGDSNGDSSSGGINIDSGASLTLTKMRVVSNRGGRGGGIYVEYGSSLTILDSTISANTAQHPNQGGGGIFNEGLLTMVNSTVSGNVKNGGDEADGGGILNSGTAAITNSTITDNGAAAPLSASGIYHHYTGGTTTIRNSIVAANRENSVKPDVVGDFISTGYNLVGNVGAANGFGANDQIGTSSAILNPQLSVLDNFGGTTPTHALFSNSTAVNAADPLNPLAADQRGIVRTIGGRADTGAFEKNFTFSNNPTGAGGNGTLPGGSTSQPYSVALSVSRTNNLLENIIEAEQTDQANLGSPFEFRLIAGSLPAGLTLNLNTGVLSGTPTQSGTFNFVIKAADLSDGIGGAQAYVLNILGPTAASVTIAGRVFTPDGRGLRNARVILTAPDGTSRTVATSSFGYFSFADVAVGQTYVISVASKRYLFQTQIINVVEDIADLNFTPIGGASKSEEQSQ